MAESKGRVGQFLLFVFGAVFFLIGLLIAYTTFGKMTVDYLRSSSWPTAPVEVQQLELQTNQGSESTTYQVIAKYRYYFDGRWINSNNVTFSSGSDNLGSYWSDLHQRLKQEKQAGQLNAFVNPDNPSEAVLDRTFRWTKFWFGFLFLITFCVVGGFCLRSSLEKTKSNEEKIDQISRQGIPSNNKHGFWFMFWFGLVFFSMGLLPALLVIPEAMEKGEYGALFILIFVVVGAGFMWYAWRQRQNYKSIGPTPLFLDPLPAIVGGQIGGYFDVKGLVSSSTVKVTLTCFKRVRSGKNTSLRIRWQDDQVPFCETTSQGTRVKFIFDCPENESASVGSIFWQVDIKGDLNQNSETKELNRTWIIPVEKGSQLVESSLDIPEHFLQKQADEVARLAALSAGEQVPVFQQDGFLNIQSQYNGGVAGILGGVLFGLIFAAVGYFLKNEWWPAYIFLAIGLLVIAVSLFVWGRKIEIKIDTALRMLHMRRSWFNIKLYHREVALFDPTQFSIKKTTSQTSGQTLTQYYAIYVENKGKQVKVAEGVSGEETVEAVLDKIIKSAFPSRSH